MIITLHHMIVGVTRGAFTEETELIMPKNVRKGLVGEQRD